MSNETLMWIGIAIWVGFAIFAAIGYYAGQTTAKNPSGSTTIFGGS